MALFGRNGEEASQKDLWLARFNTPYKHFLYLDAEETVNALSILRGGAIESITEQRTRDAGGKLSVGAMHAFGGELSAGKQVRREVVLSQNAYSAIAQLLGGLDEAGAIVRFDATSATDALTQNQLVQFEVDLEPPAHSEDNEEPKKKDNPGFLESLRGLLDRRSDEEKHADLQRERFGNDLEPDVTVPRQPLGGPTMEKGPSENSSEFRVGLRLKSRWLLIEDYEQFWGKAVVFGQVEPMRTPSSPPRVRPICIYR